MINPNLTIRPLYLLLVRENVVCAIGAIRHLQVVKLVTVLRRHPAGYAPAKLWARVADDIRPLKEPNTIGWALTEDDKQRLLKTAVTKPEWETAYLAAILGLNTTARGCELKGLQWSDIDLFQRTITIRKNEDGGG